MARYIVKWSLISLGARTAKRGDILTDKELGKSVDARLRKGSIELLDEPPDEQAAPPSGESIAPPADESPKPEKQPKKKAAKKPKAK